MLIIMSTHILLVYVEILQYICLIGWNNTKKDIGHQYGKVFLTHVVCRVIMIMAY